MKLKTAEQNIGGLAISQALRIRLKDPWLCVPASRRVCSFLTLLIIYLPMEKAIGQC